MLTAYPNSSTDLQRFRHNSSRFLQSDDTQQSFASGDWSGPGREARSGQAKEMWHVEKGFVPSLRNDQI